MFLFSMEHVAIIVVMQLPPRLSRNTDVIMELRYGMCCRDLLDKAMITLKKVMLLYDCAAGRIQYSMSVAKT